MPAWEELRRAASQGESLADLSRRCGVAYSTLVNRAVKEKWEIPEAPGLFPGTAQESFSRVAGKLLRRIEEEISGDRSFDLKEIKTLTGALKELQSLGERRDGEGGGSGALTVRFLGETEEMSE